MARLRILNAVRQIAYVERLSITSLFIYIMLFNHRHVNTSIFIQLGSGHPGLAGVGLVLFCYALRHPAVVQ